MPEHFHLLISEPEKGTPSTVLQVLKQRFSRRLRRKPRRTSSQCQFWKTDREPDAGIWQKRFYDFNVWTERKRIEKLRYMHRNPVKRGLVSEPDHWGLEQFSQLRLWRNGGGADQPTAGAQTENPTNCGLMDAAGTHLFQTQEAQKVGHPRASFRVTLPWTKGGPPAQ